MCKARCRWSTCWNAGWRWWPCASSRRWWRKSCSAASRRCAWNSEDRSWPTESSVDFFLGGMMSRNLVTRLLFVHIDLEFIDKLLNIDGFGCLWDLFRWTVPTRGRSSFLSAGHRWALPSVVRKPTKRGTDDLRSSVFYGCVAAVVQRFLPHVKTAPGQKLRNSGIFDRYPQEWPVSSAWKVFVVRCWADSGRMFHVHPFSSIFLCMSMRPKKSSKGLHQTIMPLLRLRGATSIRMISRVHQSLRIKVDK